MLLRAIFPAALPDGCKNPNSGELCLESPFLFLSGEYIHV